jgi:hypothetical protein
MNNEPKTLLWLAIIAITLAISMLCAPAQAALTDVKFSRYQIADSQWNVSACLYTTTCQIYSKNPGVMYKIPWYNGQWAWQTGQYVQFALTGNATNPYEGKVYNSNGTLAGTIGTGRIVNMGPDYFFFVGNDNNTGQLFSGTVGMNNTAGVSWTGTLNPTIAQANTISNSYSTDPLPAGTTYTSAPSLCCGSSAASFNADATNVAKVQEFINRTTADSKVNIEQIGNFNTTVVEQTGTKNNFVNYYVNGSSNTTTITQSGNASTQANYVDLLISGNSNTTNISQSSTGGTKGIFAVVNNNTNTLKVQQKDSGNHYANVSLSGGTKNVDILQQGSAAHMTNVTLSGQPTTLNLTQSGTTQQFYSITHNCSTLGGCGTISVQQGN